MFLDDKIEQPRNHKNGNYWAWLELCLNTWYIILQ